MGKKHRRKVTILHYLDSHLAALQHQIDGRITGLQQEIDGREALMQAEIDRRITAVADLATSRATSLDKRLETMNEFRAALSDQRGRMVTSDVFTTTIDAIKEARDAALISATERIEKLETAIATQRGRQAMVTSIVAILGVIIAAGSLVALFIHIGH